MRNVPQIDACVSMCTNYSRADGERWEGWKLALVYIDTALSRIQFGVSNIPIPALRTRLPLSLNYMHVECLVCFTSAIIRRN